MAYLNTAEDIIKFISLLLIEVLAFLGNGTMIIAGMRSPELRKYSNAFIFNMAFADLFQSLLVMPFSLASIFCGRWILSSRACTHFGVIKVIITMTSVLSLAGISVDRYFYIVKSRSAINSMKRVIASILLVWFISIVLSISPLFGWGELGFDHGKEACTVLFYKTVSYTLALFGVGLLIPVCTMAICYYKIFKVLRSQGLKITHSSKTMGLSLQATHIDTRDGISVVSGRTTFIKCTGQIGCKADGKRGWCESEAATEDNATIQKGVEDKQVKSETYSASEAQKDATTSNANEIVESKNSTERNEKRRKYTAKEIYLLQSVTLVLLAFISCWLPYVVLNLLRAFNIIEEKPKIDTITMWLGFANSALNPVLYGLTNRQFRNAIKKTLLPSCKN